MEKTGEGRTSDFPSMWIPSAEPTYFFNNIPFLKDFIRDFLDELAVNRYGSVTAERNRFVKVNLFFEEKISEKTAAIRTRVTK